jgi:hypothetical protein
MILSRGLRAGKEDMMRSVIAFEDEPYLAFFSPCGKLFARKDKKWYSC